MVRFKLKMKITNYLWIQHQNVMSAYDFIVGLYLILLNCFHIQIYYFNSVVKVVIFNHFCRYGLWKYGKNMDSQICLHCSMHDIRYEF